MSCRPCKDEDTGRVRSTRFIRRLGALCPLLHVVKQQLHAERRSTNIEEMPIKLKACLIEKQSHQTSLHQRTKTSFFQTYNRSFPPSNFQNPKCISLQALRAATSLRALGALAYYDPEDSFDLMARSDELDARDLDDLLEAREARGGSYGDSSPGTRVGGGGRGYARRDAEPRRGSSRGGGRPGMRVWRRGRHGGY